MGRAKQGQRGRAPRLGILICVGLVALYSLLPLKGHPSYSRGNGRPDPSFSMGFFLTIGVVLARARPWLDRGPTR
jgi:hypothetical protein